MSPLYIGIIIAGVGLVLAAGGFYTRRKAGRILSAPLRKTGEAAGANGITSCEGVVRAGQPLTAPCTNTPCVYYRLKIEKKVKEKKGGQTTTSWKKLIGAGAFSTKTKTMKLIPGDYSIYVWSSKDGPSDLLLQITELADK